MFIDLSHEDELQAWLTKTLEPICDADPNTLAEYVIALLKNEYDPSSTTKDGLQTVLAEQLQEFLPGVESFVGKFIVALQSKSYLSSATSLPATSGSKTSTAPATPSSSSTPKRDQPTQPRSRKRSLEVDDYRESERAAQRVRMDLDPSQPIPSFQPGGPAVPPIVAPGMPNREGAHGRNWQQGKPGICFDYFNKGHCRRGDQCKYSHGDNPIVGSNMPFMTNGMMPNGFPLGMMMPGFAIPMMQQLGMASGAFGRNGPGGVRRGNMADREATMLDMNPDHVPDILMQPGPDGYVAGVRQDEMDIHQQSAANGDGSRARQRENGGPGELPNGSSSQFKSRETMQSKDSGTSKHAGVTTIVVEKIPAAHVSEDAVTAYFQQFGTITNVVVDRRTKQALVTFAEKHEASKAVRSPDAPWGNKYAKVFWHNPMFGGAAGAKAVAGSAPPNPSERSRPAKPTTPSLVLNAPIKSSPASSQSLQDPNVSKRKLLLEEQKSLLSEASSATPERKKAIVARIREINKQMADSPAADTPPAPAPPKDPATLAREQLDAELDAKPPTTADTAEGSNGSSNYEALKARLESLRAEASSLGIDPMNPDSDSASSLGPGPYPPYRGFAPRGRGRGRGRARATFYTPRGRGGGPAGRANMRLDLRPKKLVVKLGATDPEKVSAVRTWFETTGDVEDCSTGPTGDVIVAFGSRSGAEQALSKGTNIPGVGPVQLAWHVDGGIAPSKPRAAATGPGGVSAENLDVEMAHDVSNTATSGLGAGNNGVEPEPETEDGESMTGW